MSERALLINDYSLGKQYRDINHFLDDLSDNTIPVLEIAKRLECEILKSQQTSSRYITTEMTLNEIFWIPNKPELSILRKYLYEITDTPHWEETRFTDLAADYSLYIDIDCNHPNCFTESCERKCILFSFQAPIPLYPEFLHDQIEIEKNSDRSFIPNAYTRDKFLKHLLRKKFIHLSEYLINVNVPFPIRFFKDYSDKTFDQILIFDDIETIIQGILELSRRKYHGDDLGRLSSFISGDNTNGVCYFRTTISSGEFRLFYKIKEGVIYFLNGILVKNSDAQEQREMNKAIKISQLL